MLKGIDFPLFSAFLLSIIYSRFEIPDYFLVIISQLEISLFGFTGLILTFLYGHLLNEKNQLEKAQREQVIKAHEVRLEFEVIPHGGEVFEALDDYEDDVRNSIEINRRKIKDIGRDGSLSLASIFLSLFSTFILSIYNMKHSVTFFVLVFTYIYSFGKIMQCIKSLIKIDESSN